MKTTDTDSVIYQILTRGRGYFTSCNEMTTHTTTECRTPDGITVGLLDSINTIAQLLVIRDFSAPEVQEALRDLRDDRAFQDIQLAMATV